MGGAANGVTVGNEWGVTKEGTNGVGCESWASRAGRVTAGV